MTDRPLKIVIVNKSDSTGGAAVVSYRLMKALRESGADARMLVVEKLTDSPYVEKCAPDLLIKWEFLAERARIYTDNGFNRSTLFQIDTGEKGLPLWRHPLMKEADAVLLNWVNQGMLSLKGVKKIVENGKPVIWTMHDMWCFTGICHYSMDCKHFVNHCGDCYLLGDKKSPSDLSFKIWEKKSQVYGEFSRQERNKKFPLFVAVSNWLADEARKSSLFKGKVVEVIPNAFRVPEKIKGERDKKGKFTLLFGAARIDVPIKGLDILKEMTHVLANDYTEIAKETRLIIFGSVKDASLLDNFAIPMEYKGRVNGETAIRELYEESDILVSAARYENLPGTLVEGQAYGCIPVAFDRGGQKDIIDHLSTGYLAKYDHDNRIAAKNLADGVVSAIEMIRDPQKRNEVIRRMKEEVEVKFSYRKVAELYISLIKSSLKESWHAT